MSKKLSEEESSLSLNSIKEYRRRFPGNNEKRVVVKKRNEIIFNEKVTVTAGDYGIYFNIAILWEDVDFDFKEYGLHGTYSSSYCKIRYDKSVLTIHADGAVIDIM